MNIYSRIINVSLVVLVALFFLMLPIGSALADSVEVRQGHENEAPLAGHKFIPYAFYNETADFAAAVTFISIGYLQPQSKTILNAFYSTNNSYNVFFYVKDCRSFLSERLFFDTWGGSLVSGV